MLAEICSQINNYFINRNQIEHGEFIIEDDMINVQNKYVVGQYIRIIGSILNDGIYQVEDFLDINGEYFVDVSLKDEDYPIWIQPTGAHDAFQYGDRVMHNNVRYISQINANIYVPGTDERWWATVSEFEHHLINESFTGTIAGLKIPRDFINLSRQVEIYEQSSDIEKRGLASMSIGSYSESRATGQDGTPLSWQNVFRKNLDRYRRMFPEDI